MDVRRYFDTDLYDRALQDWGFLPLAGKTPLFASPIGDIFLGDRDGIWWLDSTYGALYHAWQHEGQMESDLESEEARDHFFLASLVTEAAGAGLRPGRFSVYDFRVPPVLGGPVSVDNLEVMDFVLALTVRAQVHTGRQQSGGR